MDFLDLTRLNTPRMWVVWGTVWVVAAFGVCGLGVPSQANAQDQARDVGDEPQASAHGVEVFAEAFLGGYARSRSHTSVLIEVRNRGAKGTFVVDVSMGDGVSRRREVDLGNNAVQRVRVWGRGEQLGGWVVRVFRKGSDRVLARVSPKMERIDEGTVLWAYIGKRPPGVRSFDPSDEDLDAEAAIEATPPNDPKNAPPTTPQNNADRPNTRVEVVRTSLPEIPDHGLGLEGLDALFWSHPTLSRLSSTQAEALRTWVLQGGHWVVAVDDDWKQLQASPLSALFPVTLRGVDVVEDPEVLRRLVGDGTGLGRSTKRTAAMRAQRTQGTFQAAPLPKKLPVARVTPKLGATVAPVSVGVDDPIAWTWTVGSGRVTLWRTGWERVGRTPKVVDWLRWVQVPNTRMSVSSRGWAVVRSSEPPLDINVYVLLIVLVLYVLIIGPVDFLVLKRLKRLEWTVFTYTASILFFSFLAWVAMTTSHSDKTTRVRFGLQSYSLGAPRQQPTTREMWALDGHFTTRRERVSFGPPDPGVALSVGGDRPGGVIHAEKVISGSPRTLNAVAAAYSLLPTALLQIETLPKETPDPVAVDLRWDASAPESLTPPNSLLFTLRNDSVRDKLTCTVTYGPWILSEFFELPPIGETFTAQGEDFQSLGTKPMHERLPPRPADAVGGYNTMYDLSALFWLDASYQQRRIHTPDRVDDADTAVLGAYDIIHDPTRGQVLCMNYSASLVPLRGIEAEEHVERAVVRFVFPVGQPIARDQAEQLQFAPAWVWPSSPPTPPQTPPTP